MKIYQVVKRGSEWHVLMPDASTGVQPGADKSRVITSACELASPNNGAVQVRDSGGQVEKTYIYVDGVVREHDCEQSRKLRLSRAD